MKQKGKSPRRLTPRECARLMGFDEPGQTPFRIPVSDTQAYKQFGNAVVVPVVKAVAAHYEAVDHGRGRPGPVLQRAKDWEFWLMLSMRRPAAG